jgi:hypothetical protein
VDRVDTGRWLAPARSVHRADHLLSAGRGGAADLVKVDPSLKPRKRSRSDDPEAANEDQLYLVSAGERLNRAVWTRAFAVLDRCR